ncbi:uncharacterized protein LOC130719082 [Lotus japonicus]|uniref:uncharacterized protein LOC130719082 n=1 Tax=Lotus japonicus TaxID=34305 RepID=UPI00258D5CCC|nr:uncharacterized protein LOC130719082 [Lotus japonicus]
MKLHTKPISSPGRTEKFPPPLMRFLRTSTGSRSRGRSRSSSSTVFLRKKNNTVIEALEPSSPKVTCMGQVRARRSRPSSSSAGAPTSSRRRCCCCWFPHALFCGIFKTKPGSCCQCKPVQPNWRFFCFFRRRKKEEASTKKTGSSFSDSENDESENDESEIENRVKANAFVCNSSCSTTPPRNALLLTRCRSAPYRSSSLACRFWGSPLRNEEEGEGEETEHENRVPSETQRPSESDSVEGMNKDQKMEEKLRFFKELEDSFRERLKESEKVHELKRRDQEEEEEDETEGDSAKPLVLTRCKSEPARIAAQKLEPEVKDFREKDKFGFC